jgi:hypothetical protein
LIGRPHDSGGHGKDQENGQGLFHGPVAN